ncbi:hypothetical protein SAMN03080598_00265 [Algoriphagus boritolerans DSM 17298 = JCM 18970]|uniref:Uncharacterized protein n=1 Tax=Algoriphagus boritolerans DSM 17298 = JCM 18970 TaxID=1120964 RepID=A0A1H5S3H2_9BACT|nr:hypothetical protein SAMN03080598_00265 [Algoriphagus boritolerans DSM 17298 = JCM 18970]
MGQFLLIRKIIVTVKSRKRLGKNTIETQPLEKKSNGTTFRGLDSLLRTFSILFMHGLHIPSGGKSLKTQLFKEKNPVILLLRKQDFLFVIYSSALNKKIGGHIFR